MLSLIEITPGVKHKPEGVVEVEAVDEPTRFFCVVEGRVLTKIELEEKFKTGDAVPIHNGVIKKI